MRNYKDAPKNFAENLKTLKEEKGLSYEKIADDTGIPQTSLYEYARAIRALSIERAMQIASYFGTTADEMALTPEEFNVRKSKKH